MLIRLGGVRTAPKIHTANFQPVSFFVWELIPFTCLFENLHDGHPMVCPFFSVEDEPFCCRMNQRTWAQKKDNIDIFCCKVSAKQDKTSMCCETLIVFSGYLRTCFNEQGRKPINRFLTVSISKVQWTCYFLKPFLGWLPPLRPPTFCIRRIFGSMDHGGWSGAQCPRWTSMMS